VIFMYESREHKVNHLLKQNREHFETIRLLLRKIEDNESQLAWLYRELAKNP
jgi:hypothetical protein